MGLLRGQYQFEEIYEEPKNCGGLLIFQLGEIFCKPTTVIPDHEQLCYEYTYVISGKGKVLNNGISMSVSKGDCVISFPGDAHSVISDKNDPLRFAFCAFDSDGREVIWKNLINEIKNVFSGISEKICCLSEKGNVFYEMISEINSSDTFSDEMVGILFAKFTITLLRVFKKERQKFYSPQIKNETILTYGICNYLKTNLCEIKKLTQLEQVFNYNYRYITRCFKKIMGEPLNDYFIRCRMEYAKDMLKEGFSVTQVSEMLGYSSIHVFSRSFKRHFSVSPIYFHKK